jgi:hypothetical protein
MLAIPWDSLVEVGFIVVLALSPWAVWWLWWRLPKRQLRKLDIQIHDPKARADAEDNFRKTVGQALGGAAVLIGATAAYLEFRLQQQTLIDQFVAQEVSRRLQADGQLVANRISQEHSFSDQVGKGFEQLASGKIMMRLGGVYVLEGVMNTQLQYNQPVLEGLCAFVRESTIEKVKDRPPIDVQAALTAIGRRQWGEVNLAGANIPGADLFKANLKGANLSSVDLSAANLSGADLTNANLSGTKNLTQPQLDQACGKPRAPPPGLTSDNMQPCPP